MGQTRVIYSDATTAEASSILKSCGFLESNQGGLFTSPTIPIKVYIVWGKSSYYPDISARLNFSPRIQIHLKYRESTPQLADLALGVINGLRGISAGARVTIFNANTGEELQC